MRESSISQHLTRRRLAAAACLILLFSSLTLAQAADAEVFGAIPEAQRPRLIERLNLLIEYQKTQQWAKQYDLLSSLTKSAEGKQDFINRTRQAYTKWGRTPLISFTPYNAGQMQVAPGRMPWVIAGCSQVLEKGEKVSKLAMVEAYREKGDWYFSEVQNVGAGSGNDPCAVLSGLPQLKGHVNDVAAILDSTTKEQLERVLNNFKAEAGVDMAILTVKTTGNLSAYDYSLATARFWRAGTKNPGKDGVFILIAVDDRKWHIQITRALQEILSDEDVAELGRLMIAPFKEGHYAEGIRRCVDAFIKKISELRGVSLRSI
jgi:hypothetical protein